VRDVAEDGTVAELLGQAWQRFHVQGRWRLGEDALLLWDSGPNLLADGPCQRRPRCCWPRPDRRDCVNLPLQRALEDILPWVAKQPLKHASYIGLFP
jgi:hypothetical protein